MPQILVTTKVLLVEKWISPAQLPYGATPSQHLQQGHVQKPAPHASDATGRHGTAPQSLQRGSSPAACVEQACTSAPFRSDPLAERALCGGYGAVLRSFRVEKGVL